MVAGEASGDRLGAELIGALRQHWPDAEFFGIAGPLMRSQGCQAWYEADRLAVMGLFEVIPLLPRLLRIRGDLLARLLREPPDVYIGVDYKEFNLSIERRLKARGIRTVQYVSPQIWAWREGRVRGIGAACDLMLCLLPFEPAFYARFNVAARFVGHPLADQIPLDVDRGAARQRLALPMGVPVVALLPGSRVGEVARLSGAFIDAARRLRERVPGVQFIAPMASEEVRAVFEAAAAGFGPAAGVAVGLDALGIRVVVGQAQDALQAADVALVASGTASLEALLCRCPMVVAYRLGALTAWLVRGLKLVRLQNFSLPNLLAGETLVPEFFQEAANGERLAQALYEQLRAPTHREHVLRRFRSIHESLRLNGAASAAAAVVACVAAGE